MDAAGDGKALGIVNLNEISQKKIFRARKTMAASCRQQISALSKIKNVSIMENSVNKLNDPPTVDAVQLENSETVCTTNYMAQTNVTPVEGESYESTLVQDVSGLNSGSSIKCSWKPTNGMNESTLAESSSHLSSMDNDRDNVSDNNECQQNGLVPISSVEESNLQGAKKDCSKSNDDYCSETTTIRTINKESSLKMDSAVRLVTPVDFVYEDSSNAAIPNHGANTASTIGTSNTVAVNYTLDRLANSASPDFSQDGNSASGNCKRKRTCSADGEDSKRAKTSSNKSLIDEIHQIIERRIQTVFKESFDQRIQDLSQQIGLIQSKENHADSIAVHVRRIRKLGKRIKYALEVQNEIGAASSNLQPVSAASNKPAIDSPTNLAAAESTVLHKENNSTQNQSTVGSNLVVLSDNESEQPRNPEKGKTEAETPKKVDNEAIRKILESIKEHRNKTLSSRVVENGKTIIDLTDDEEQKSDKDLKGDETMTSSPVSVQVSDNGNQKSLVTKEMLANGKEEPDVNERTPSVPKCTQTVKPPDSGTSTPTAPNPYPCILKPPQKPELRLAQVQNPKGIALSWNITQVDPNCAPAKVYCLYVNQENPNSAKKLWKKIGEIKALPLPMACTLTQFVDDATYSFALRAKDAFGRFGPLCDIQSTTLKSLTTLKKV